MPSKNKSSRVNLEPRQLLCFGRGKTFTITIPGDAKVTFGPWSPPQMVKNDRMGYGPDKRHFAGTIRVYDKSKANILGVFSGVEGYFDTSLDYNEVDASLLGYNGLNSKKSTAVEDEEIPF